MLLEHLCLIVLALTSQTAPFPFSFKVLYCFTLKYDAKHENSDAAPERVRKAVILRKKIGMLDKLQHGES